MYSKNPTNSDTRKICCNHPTIGTSWPYHRVIYLKDADRIANSLDPVTLIWVCTVCQDLSLSVQKLKIITVI